MATITRQNLLAHVAAEDDTRPALAGILIDLEHKRAVSANGFLMLMTPLPAQDGAYTAGPEELARRPIPPVILRASDVQAIAKSKPRSYLPSGIVVTIADGRATLAAIDKSGQVLTTTVGTIDATYPNYMSVVPTDHDDDLVIGLDLALVIRLVKAMQTAGATSAHFRFPKKPGKAIRLDAKDESGKPITGVLMPMHIAHPPAGEVSDGLSI